MKALKYVGIALGAVIALVLVAALFISKDVHYHKSITINAPIDSV